jgi:hypothetical protein
VAVAARDAADATVLAEMLCTGGACKLQQCCNVCAYIAIAMHPAICNCHAMFPAALQSALGIDHPSPQALAALQSKQQHLDKQRHEMQVRSGGALLLDCWVVTLEVLPGRILIVHCRL